MSASEINPYFTENGTYKPINPIVSYVGDFTPFYIAITICTVILGALLVFNIVCCCSRYSDYWLDRHTGNRWLVSIWSATPHKQPPLDFTELQIDGIPIQFGPIDDSHVYQDIVRSEPKGSKRIEINQPLSLSPDYELHKRESDL